MRLDASAISIWQQISGGCVESYRSSVHGGNLKNKGSDVRREWVAAVATIELKDSPVGRQAGKQ